MIFFITKEQKKRYGKQTTRDIYADACVVCAYVYVFINMRALILMQIFVAWLTIKNHFSCLGLLPFVYFDASSSKFIWITSIWR